jgi:hypothetical protein
MKNMTILKIVRITASIIAKFAYGPVPSIIGSVPRINTNPAEMGASSKTADIIMKMTPVKINRKLKRKKFRER